jgi:hypothetical protein
MKRNIPYYVKDVYGNRMEYIASKSDAAIIQQLTGKKTVDGRVRELIRDLTGGQVNFTLVPQP